MAIVVRVLPLQIRPAGDYAFGPVVIPVGLVSLQIGIDRPDLTLSAVVEWACDLSLDSGGTWAPWGAARAIGGSFIDPETGLEALESYFTVPLPDPVNTERQLRGRITLNEPLRIGMSVKAS